MTVVDEVEIVDEVEMSELTQGRRLPLLARPTRPGARLDVWIGGNRRHVEAELSRHGGILFRGFDLSDPRAFERVVGSVSGEALDYVYRSTPRTALGNKIFTATEYPPKQTIPLHNEEAYQRDWPMRLLFHCVQPAAQGGETLIADTLKVTARIDPAVREKFLEKGVMYVRNYGGGADLSWQTVFQTESKAKVEIYCRDHDISFEWKPDERLRTAQVCQVMSRHPATGDHLWFNQAHLFHVSSLAPKARDAMLAVFGEEELPRHAFYGDGSPLEEDVLEHIREAFRAETVSFPWQADDVLLLDNMLAAHGRSPYQGARRVLVAMTDAYSTSCGSRN
jgi:alpha-ketoglutarate-dependent taurine dioxygenase